MLLAAEDPSLADAAATFARDGYYVARGMLSPEEVNDILTAFMDEAKNGPVPGLSDILKTAAPADPLSFYPRMMHPHIHPEKRVGQIAERYLLDPRIEAHLRPFMGEPPVGVQSMFYFKPPGARGQTWHQDNYYLRVRPKTCCAAWIAVDDADAENGGMSVVPGTHEMEIVCPEQADMTTSFTADHVPVPAGLTPKMLDLKAGDILFFNGSLVHGSTPNTSKTRFRRSLICHYVPESTTEMSHWYQGALRTFDKSTKDMTFTTGGGPCGQDAGRH